MLLLRAVRLLNSCSSWLGKVFPFVSSESKLYTFVVDTRVHLWHIIRYVQQTLVLPTSVDVPNICSKRIISLENSKQTNTIYRRHHLDHTGAFSIVACVHHPDSVRIAPHPLRRIQRNGFSMMPRLHSKVGHESFIGWYDLNLEQICLASGIYHLYVTYYNFFVPRISVVLGCRVHDTRSLYNTHLKFFPR